MQRAKPHWYKLIVDGKAMDVWPSSKSTQKRMKLNHLRGIKIEDAKQEKLMERLIAVGCILVWLWGMGGLFWWHNDPEPTPKNFSKAGPFVWVEVFLFVGLFLIIHRKEL